MGLANDAATRVAEAVQKHVDTCIETAIRQTDWDETAVLLVYVSQPDPLSGDSIIPEIHIERFDDRVPNDHEHQPNSTLYTITKPLLERLSEEYEGVSAVL